MFTATLASTIAQTDAITATEGSAQETTFVTFNAGPASAANSSIVANPGSVTADGTSITTLDGDGRGRQRQCGWRNGSHALGQRFWQYVSPISGTTSASGVFTATLASTIAQTDAVTATEGSAQETTSVTFNAGPPSAAKSSIVASPTTIFAGGSGAAVTVTVEDTQGNAVSGTAVTLSASGPGNTFAPASGTTNANGVFTASLASTHAQTETVDAMEGSLVEFTTVTFVAGVTDQLADDTGASSTDKITSDPTLTGSGIPNAAATISEGSKTLGTATADASGTWSFPPSGLAEGAHTLIASETDAAGNTGTASLTFTLDTVAPAVTESLFNDTGSSSADKITSNPKLTGGGDQNATVTVTENGTILGTAGADASGVWNLTPASLAQGVHTIVASETDLAGNIGTASLSFTLDTVPPAVTSIHTVRSSSNSGGTEQFAVQFSEAVTGVASSAFALTDTGTVTGTIGTVSGSGVSYTVTVTGASGAGTMRLDLKSSGTGIADLAGNVSGGFTSGQTYTIDPGPTAGNAHLYIAPGQSFDLTSALLALDTPGCPATR